MHGDVRGTDVAASSKALSLEFDPSLPNLVQVGVIVGTFQGRYVGYPEQGAGFRSRHLRGRNISRWPSGLRLPGHAPLANPTLDWLFRRAYRQVS